MDLQTSDWVHIIVALFLGACALSVPYLVELLKRKYFAPVFKIEFEHGYPYCHQTVYSNRQPVYYFRFRVVNTGESQAKSCEGVLEELWLADSAGRFIQEKNFSPVNLNWSGQFIETPTGRIPKQFIDINQERRVFCDIGHINHPVVTEKSVFYLEEDNKELKFLFDINPKFYSQRDCVSPGKAKIKVAIYSQNARKHEKYFSIAWSGRWKDREEDMFKEIVIEKL